MDKDIFRTVHDLLDSRNCVMSGGAVDMQGALYEDCVDNLRDLSMMEPSLFELLDACERAGLGELQCFREVAGLLGRGDA
jgi:hypothetical protein